LIQIWSKKGIDSKNTYTKRHFFFIFSTQRLLSVLLTHKILSDKYNIIEVNTHYTQSLHREPRDTKKHTSKLLENMKHVKKINQKRTPFCILLAPKRPSAGKKTLKTIYIERIQGFEFLHTRPNIILPLYGNFIVQKATQFFYVCIVLVFDVLYFV
jgi:hypothetical protein